MEPAPSLPIDAVLPAVRAALRDEGAVVVQAPPGAGKTTRLPLDLIDHDLCARMVLLEPRRVAARAAARRLAAQRGEPVGATVGLTTRDERRTSAATRIEVVTEGVLLRRLQRDPGLDDVDLLLFDEFHERNLEADLALAFALESRDTLRPDLRLVVASATLEGERVAALLGGAPVVTAEGRLHAVEVEHRERPGVGAALAAGVADAVADVLAAGDGDVLVFLPGAAEIRRVAAELAEHPPSGDPLLLPLHGALPPEDQDAALAPAPAGRRKVVLSTDVAESSLTIDGIRAVVDAGLSREPRFDAATGMTGLVTVPASRASAEQRTGRAGRTAPGRAVRLWPAREHPARDAAPRPAILTDDLTAAALEVAAWGTDVADLALLDPPPPASWRRAQATLRDLGALDGAGRITDHGRRLAALPVHPRLAQLVVVGAASGRGALACAVAAVLADRDLLVTTPEAPCADLVARVRVLRGETAPPGTRPRRGTVRRARREARRLARLATRELGVHVDLEAPGTVDSAATVDAAGTVDAARTVDAAGALVAVGWPDRVAAARPGRRSAFLLAGGRGATLPDGDLLAGEPWLAAAHVDRGSREARIRLAAPVTPDELRDVLPHRITTVEEVGWDGDIVAERREQLGSVVLSAQPIVDPDPDRLLAALLDGLRQDGLGLLGWTPDARQLQARVALLRRELGADWPDLSDAALLRRLEEVVGPFLLAARRRADLASIRVDDVLRAQLSPSQLADIDRLAPAHLTVPSGSRIRVDYTCEGGPALAVRVQELFGAATTPAVVEGRVPVRLHLLSPARRPVQVTDDLAGFWERAYPEVRSQLRGRYPKHDWPEDPLRATPRRGVRPRRRG